MDTWFNGAPNECSRYVLVWETLNKDASGTIIVMLKLHRNWETRPRASQDGITGGWWNLNGG